MAEKLDDVWTDRDFPVLVDVARLLETAPGHALDAEYVAAATGVPQRDVDAALTNLSNGYLTVEISPVVGGHRPEIVIRSITDRGLRQVGSWPSPETAADRLIAALEREADSAPEGSAKHTRLRAILDGFAAAGRDLTVEVAAAVITGRLPT